MADVLFLQGAGAGVHAAWDIHMVESLRRELGPSYVVRYPPMPREEDPRMDQWRAVIEREVASLPPGGVVVGHSFGGTTLIHSLADVSPAPALGALLLIAAPFVGEGGWEMEQIAPRPHLPGRLPADVPIILYHGEADAEVPVAHVDLYAAAIPRARVRRLAGRDHQLNNDVSEVARDIRALTSS